MVGKATETYIGKIEIDWEDFWFMISKGRFYLRSVSERNGDPTQEHELRREAELNHSVRVEYVSDTIILRPQQHLDLENMYQEHLDDETSNQHEKRTK